MTGHFRHVAKVLSCTPPTPQVPTPRTSDRRGTEDEVAEISSLLVECLGAGEIFLASGAEGGEGFSEEEIQMLRGPGGGGW